MYYSFAKTDRKNKNMSSQLKSKIMVFDVDGVLYKNIFLIKLIRAKGLKNFLKILLLGIKYYSNRITLNTLLIEGYKLAENFTVSEMQNIAKKIKRVKNIKETVHTLQQEGFYVALISAGIPNFILETLAGEIGADSFTGLDLEVVNSTVKTHDIQVISKVKIVEKLQSKLQLTWDDTISIGEPEPASLLNLNRCQHFLYRTRHSSDMLECIPKVVYPFPIKNLYKESPSITSGKWNANKIGLLIIVILKCVKTQKLAQGIHFESTNNFTLPIGGCIIVESSESIISSSNLAHAATFFLCVSRIVSG